MTPAGVRIFVPDASATAKGKVELATPAEARTGTDDERAITAEGLASKLPSMTLAEYNALATKDDNIYYFTS